MNGPKRRWIHLCVVGLVAIVSMGACGGPGNGDDPDDVGAARAAIESIAALGVANAAEPLPGLVSAAQPTREQIDGLRTLGYQSFVSLRPQDEAGAGWEEDYLGGGAAEFARIPIAGAADLTRENVEALDRVLDAAAGDPVVLYCASSNRVGALLALRAYWLDGAEEGAALELGREAGLAGLEPAVRELLAGPR
jgi:protein tyrosine phosphatase (PTP) superfamily phosphohydrolase (DUF442 family)